MGPKPRTGAALAILIAAAASAGCGGEAARKGANDPAILDLTSPAQPLPVERFAEPDGARIAPGDLLELRVLGFPELSGTFLVASDGRINMSLIGSIQAAGKTAEELDRDLTAALGTYYRNLDVAVNVNVRASRDVYVLGEVTKPGRFDFHTGSRVLHALAEAGGMTDKARENSVILMRREADGDHAYRLDFGRMHDRIAPRDIYLQPGDVVFVPRSRLRTVTEVSTALLDVVGRTATTALVADDLTRRTRALTLSR